MDERKNLLGPNLIKNENIMPLLYQFLKVYQLKMTKQYQTRSVFENISTSIMTVDYSRVPSPSSCVPLPPLGGGGGDGPTTTLSPLPYHKQGVKKFRASENILLPYRLFNCNWRLPNIFPNFICIFGPRSKILCYDFLCLPLSGCFSPAPVV